MNANEICELLGKSLPSLFACSLAPREGVKVRTPMLLPDGGVVDVFVVSRGDRFLVTDFGDAVGWITSRAISDRRSPRQTSLIRDVCLTLRIELVDEEQLVLRDVAADSLGEAVVRVAQAVVRVSDVWFTMRIQAIQDAGEEVNEWLREREIPFERNVTVRGLSGTELNIPFLTRVEARTSYVFLLSTGTRGAVKRVTEHVVAGFFDLSHIRTQDAKLGFVSLFDDTHDVWQEEDFKRLEPLSEIALWSQPSAFEGILRGDRGSRSTVDLAAASTVPMSGLTE